MDDLDQFLHQQMKSAGFRQAWQESQMDFDVAEMLIKARFEQRLSQREMADKAGIRQSNLSRIERGQCTPDLNTLRKIASGLGKRLKIQFV